MSLPPNQVRWQLDQSILETYSPNGVHRLMQLETRDTTTFQAEHQSFRMALPDNEKS